MSHDELIEHLEQIKAKHNGKLPVFISLACVEQEFKVLSWVETKSGVIVKNAPRVTNYEISRHD